ncbi:MAG: hypothetical protein J5676_06395 [Bacteroidaceae bacterium]|nr:hypothetical protein [Bacteroidaceae bacterium]
MGKLRLVLVFCLVLGNSSTLFAQKFHFDVDYYRYYGFKEKWNGASFDESSAKLGGWGIHLVPRYDITPSLSAGVGVGITAYKSPDHGSIPFFATLRYKPLKNFSDFYTFTDLGYSARTEVAGFTGTAGVGYTHMFAKHFGINFQLAYNYRRFNNISYYVVKPEYYGEGEDDYGWVIDKYETTGFLHSLSLGVGVTF